MIPARGRPEMIRGRGVAVSRLLPTLLPTLILALLASAGCGFQLRGAVEIPADLSPLYIQSGGAIGGAIESRLTGSGVTLTSVPAEAGLILRILSQSRSSRVVALDIDGKALAYLLIYRVAFDAQDAAGNELVPRQSFGLERTFDDNPDVAVLGKALESDIIYQDLASDAADQVLLRLRAALATRSPG
jgi:LPS-assembly lipoprotein